MGTKLGANTILVFMQPTENYGTTAALSASEFSPQAGNGIGNKLRIKQQALTAVFSFTTFLLHLTQPTKSSGDSNMDL